MGSGSPAKVETSRVHNDERGAAEARGTSNAFASNRTVGRIDPNGIVDLPCRPLRPVAEVDCRGCLICAARGMR